MMRKVTYGAAVSLDGYIAGDNDRIDWLKWSDDVALITGAYWETVDCVLVGRRTYEAGLRSGTRSYPGKVTYVFSRTLRLETSDDVVQVSSNAVEFVRTLKHEEGRGICVMGGGELAQGLLDAGLVDEVGCNIHPVLLGSGVPLFRALSQQRDLELIESRNLDHGCIYLLYRVVGVS